MFSPDFNICQPSCNSLKFFDLTGQYEATDNPGGWSSINPSEGDVTSALLNITDSDGNIIVVDITTNIINTETEICLDATALGLSDTLADGVYTIEWVIDVDAPTVATYTVCKEFFFYCNAKCAVDNLIANMATPGCGCACKGDSALDNTLLAFTLLKGLESAACCYKIEKFNNLLEAITTLSEDSSCKTCG